jgi:hypothetical protein
MYSALLLENVSIEEVKSDFGLQITLPHVLERQPEQLGDSSPRFIVDGRRKFGGALAEGWIDFREARFWTTFISRRRST